MGIGGSGMSAAAIIAKKQGYKVSGCDLSDNTPYLEKLKKEKIPVKKGHDIHHLKGVDILTVTPAAFFANDKIDEISKAKKVITWQNFLGEYLQKGKKVICIAGTHGKSTTTAMAGLLFEEMKHDPTVMVGAGIKKWKSNARAGKGNIFITESDEFFDNFLNYAPDTIILNNIEFDHPDFFKNEKQLFESFKRHIQNLTGSKTLIFNQDCPGIKRLLDMFDKDFISSIKKAGYTLKEKALIETEISFRAKDIVLGKEKTHFTVENSHCYAGEKIELLIPGIYNVSNAMGVIVLSALENIKFSEIKKFFLKFDGIERRMELIGKRGGVSVFEDYAHHPTAVKETLKAVRQKYPKSRIWAVVEPHSYSRTSKLLHLYRNCFEAADMVLIAPIFKARDKNNFNVSEKHIARVSNHKNIKHFKIFNMLVEYYESKVKKGNVVVVMGAGESYNYTRKILYKTPR